MITAGHRPAIQYPTRRDACLNRTFAHSLELKDQQKTSHNWPAFRLDFRRFPIMTKFAQPTVFIASALLLATQPSTTSAAELLSIPLDGNAEVNVHAANQQISARIGTGAKFTATRKGQGLLPAAGQPALLVETPKGFWRKTGTLGFSFKSSRLLSSGPGAANSDFKTRLVDSPLFSANLRENSSRISLEVALKNAAGKELTTRLYWSRLSGNQWYHLAFAWDANAKSFECYLNGSSQEKFRFRPSLNQWRISPTAGGQLTLGGTGGSKGHFAAIAIDDIQVFDKALTEAKLRKALQGRARIGLAGEGRTEYFGKLNFHNYDLELFYIADFSSPLNVVSEDELFKNGKRDRKPTDNEWVLEGPGRAWTEDDKLHLASLEPDKKGHVVLWNTRQFPENCLIEFDVSPSNSTNGLNIIFFAAQSRDGKGIFDLSLPKRDGVFKNYHSGALDSYHISYWACAPDNGGTPRRTANVRKNHGFQLVSCGSDNIAAQGPGPHVVRLLKFDGRIVLETAGKLSAAWFDSGNSHGPALKGGRIGLRQMGHTRSATYDSFTVYKVKKKERALRGGPKKRSTQ